MHKSEHNTRGATLMETVVYVAIVSVTIYVLMVSLINLSHAYRITKTAIDVTNEGSSAMERMIRDIRSAESVDTSNSTLGSSPGVLTITTASGTVKYYVTNGGLNVDENGVSIGSLTRPNVSVTNLVFRQFATSTVEGIKIEMTVQGGTTTSLKTANYYSFAVLRGSYQ